MPEFSKSLTPANTAFGGVRSVVPTRGTGDVIGKALSDVVQGVTVFGQANAREAGRQAALSATGDEQSLEEVNQDVDKISEAMRESLKPDGDVVGVKQSKRQIEEARDKALSSIDVTRRSLESAFNQKHITRTELNARMRSLVAQTLNEGSNYLFKDQFVNAASSVTGGAKGSALNTMFPETADETLAKETQAAQIKATAAREGEITTLQLNNPGRSRESLEKEYNFAAQQAVKLKEFDAIKAQRNLNATEYRQSVDIEQGAFSQSIAKKIGEFSGEDGNLDPESAMLLKREVAAFIQKQRVQSGEVSGIGVSDRDSLEADMVAYGKSVDEMLSLHDGRAANKSLLEAIKVNGELYGAAANPAAVVLGKANPTLLEAYNKMPSQSRARITKEILGEEGALAFENSKQVISDMAAFATGNVNRLVDKRNPALGYGDPDARTEYGSNEKISNSLYLLNLDPNVSSVSFSSMGDIFSRNETVPEDSGEAKAALDLFDASRTGWMNSIRVLNSQLPTVSQNGMRTVMDIDQGLIDNVPGIQESLHSAYNAMRLNPWVWNAKGFESADEAFNAYIDGRFNLKHSAYFAEPEEQKEATPVKKQVVEEDAPLSVKNNNPGNLRSFGDVPTVDTPSGKFAKFETPEQGVRALARDLDTKISRGDNSVGGILKIYSPDTDPENVKRGSKVEDYIDFVEKKTGFKRDEVLGSEDQVARLMRAIIDFESGRNSNITDEQIRQGIEDAKRR